MKSKRVRVFFGVFFLQISTILFIVINVGYFIDIPFVPKNFVVRFPAFILFSTIYCFTVLLCLNQQKVVPQIFLLTESKNK